MTKFESTISDLRDALDDAESLSAADRRAIDVEVDSIEAIFNRMEEERDALLDSADAMESEDEVDTKVRDGLARELEPIFGAIFAGDVARARGGGKRPASRFARRRSDHRCDPARQIAGPPASARCGLN